MRWDAYPRDSALSVKSQQKSIDAIGGVKTLIPIDNCQCLMVSEPERLAEILVDRCQLYGLRQTNVHFGWRGGAAVAPNAPLLATSWCSDGHGPSWAQGLSGLSE